MRKAATKALYLFLCSILGMVLFAMLHRAVFVLYDVILILDYDTYSFGMSQAMILAVDFFTMLGALFFGGWYGTLLGIDWYSSVYGVNAESKAGLFHGIVPHNWRKPSKKQPELVMPNPAVTKVAVKSSVKATPKSPIASTSTWDFDDFLKATPEPKKRVAAKKPAVKKVVRKTTATPKVVKQKTAKIIAE